MATHDKKKWSQTQIVQILQILIHLRTIRSPPATSGLYRPGQC